MNRISMRNPERASMPRRVLTVLSTRRLLQVALSALFLIASMIGVPSASAQTTACGGAGCVTAGPRLASVNSTQSLLLNGLLTTLGGSGSAVNISAADWNAIATGSISLPKLLGSIQSTQGLGSPTQALSAQVNVGTLISAAASTASSAGNTTLAAALNDVSVPLSLTSGTIAVGDLVKTDAGVGNTSLNALELVTGAVQTLNSKNTITTPQAVTLSGAALGLSGVGNVTLSAQVVEPPVYVCGVVGSTFHTASVRIKLNLALLNTSADVGLLTALLGNTVSLTLVNLDLYIELAKGNGVITQINALANSMSVSATPGVADMYLGVIADSVFFDRSRGVASTIATSNIGYSTIGSLTILGQTVAVGVRASAVGSAATATPMTFTGTTATTQTATTGAAFATNLISTLMSNLSIQLTPNISLLTTVSNALLSVVQNALSGILTPLISGVVQPLLDDLGLELGQMDVNAAGAFYLCTITGIVYNDVNHSLHNDSGEAGLATATYAKLVATNATTGPPTVAATVDPTTGIYTFTNVAASSYSIVVNTSTATTAVTAAAPTGWLPTEQPTMTRAITVTNTVLTAQNFGFWHGSTLSGTVFQDTGVGTGGVANNAVKDGTEAGLQGGTVTVTDSTGATAYDTETTDGNGAYTLWIPYTAGAASLKVTDVLAATYTAVGANVGTTSGVFTLATRTVAYTNAIGTAYTGVNFAVVPANQFITDGQQTTLPGSTVFYTHVFTAGTAGSLTFVPVSTATDGYSALPYLDANCNGKIDTGEAIISAAQAVVAAQKVCIVMKVFVPENAAINTRYPLALTAHFVFANISMTGDLLHNDLTVVSNATSAGLLLTKAVNKSTALPGDTLVYTITYLNQSTTTLLSLNVFDFTPSYTVFAAAVCGTLPTGMTCSVPTKPSVGAAGAVQWTFVGALPSGASGTVTLSVVVQ